MQVHCAHCGANRPMSNNVETACAAWDEADPEFRAELAAAIAELKACQARNSELKARLAAIRTRKAGK